MSKKADCESCGKKPAEYVLDDRQLCVECYKQEEDKAEAKQKIPLTA